MKIGTRVAHVECLSMAGTVVAKVKNETPPVFLVEWDEPGRSHHASHTLIEIIERCWRG